MQVLWKTVWYFLKKVNMVLLYDPTIPLLCINSREITTQKHTQKIAALLVIAKNGKTQMSITNELTNKI